MAVVGRGRIVVWEGGSLWLLAGAQNVAQAAYHAHHAIQLTLSLEGGFRFRTAVETTSSPVVAVASDSRHSFEASGAAAFLFIEPEGPIGRSLTVEWFASCDLRSLSPAPFETYIAKLRDSFPASDEALVALGKDMIAGLGAGSSAHRADRRVTAITAYVGRNIEQPLSLAAIAGHVNLSPSRASHLFVEQAGIPLKSYVLWRRLGRALEIYANGGALTEAAHAAGFSDSAHLSRTFRRMFGVPAATLKLEGMPAT